MTAARRRACGVPEDLVSAILDARAAMNVAG